MTNFITLHDYRDGLKMFIRIDEISSVREDRANGRCYYVVALRDGLTFSVVESISEIKELIADAEG